MLESFPKVVVLKDGTEVTLRPMVREDEAALRTFFQGTEAQDRLFMKDDVTDPAVIARWCRELNLDRVFPILAVKDGRVVGNATLHRDRMGWYRAVGELRLIIASEMRSKGLGRLMIAELLNVAHDQGLELIQGRLMEGQVHALQVFLSLGFKKTAILPRFVKDMQGKRRDLIIVVSDMEELWGRFQDLLADMDRLPPVGWSE